MAKLSDILDVDILKKEIEDKYIIKVKHPQFNIFIYNYSKTCIIDNHWNETIMVCRGLITDENDNIISRPFKKFFNYEELDKNEIPQNLSFEVYEKLDGSLGILYFYKNTAYIATRGSFTSDQSIHATELLNIKYKHVIDKLDKSKTYLFEIIYPENHIIVSYGNIDDIFLLAVIDNETGNEIDPYKYIDYFNVVKRYDGIKDYTKVRDMFSDENKEGFVIKFSNNFRMKMKFAEYFRLHSLICNISQKKILKFLADNHEDSIQEILSLVDEENKIYYGKIVDDFKNQYKDIENYCKSIKIDYETDKEAASYILKEKYPSVLFNMRKNKDYTNSIWKIIKNNFKNKNVDEEL